MKRILVLLLAVGLFSLLTAYKRQSPSGTMLSESEQKAVLAFSEPKTDNLLAGLSSGNYAVFSKDFSQAMLQSMPPSKFEQWKKEQDARLGWYLRREVEGMVKRSDGTYTVIYQASFGYNDEVLIRVVFLAEPPHQITGLWFEK